MGGVDMHDMQRQIYGTHQKTSNGGLLDMAIVNSFLVYREADNSLISLKGFWRPLDPNKSQEVFSPFQTKLRKICPSPSWMCWSNDVIIRLLRQFLGNLLFLDWALVFFSFCTNSFKSNSILSLLNWAFNIFSNCKLIHQEFQFFTSFFHSNGFPLTFIQTKIKAFFNKKYQNIATSYTNEQKLYFVLPFFGHQSEKLFQ